MAAGITICSTTARAPGIADIEVPWPDPVDPARFAGMGNARHAAEVRGHGVFMGGLSAGIMEMAAWMRGFDNYFADFANNETLIVALMRKVMEMKMAYWEKATPPRRRLRRCSQRG
jgi:uroporphyrinogen decarboxylase